VASESNRAALGVQAFVNDKKKTLTLVGVADTAMDVTILLAAGTPIPSSWTASLTTPSRDGVSDNGAVVKIAKGVRVHLSEPAVFTLVGR